MGIQNLDSMTLTNGLTLSNCYLSFTPGAVQFPLSPNPLTFSWTVDTHGIKTFSAGGTLYVHTSKACKDAGCVPLQTSQFSMAGDALAQSVFGTFYATLQNQYTHTQAQG